MFYNTVNSKGNELKSLNKKTLTQEQLILNVFRKQKRELTPFEVHEMLGQITCPIGSVRRAITDLTTKGFLLKTKSLKKGIYSVKNHTWKLNGNNKH